MRIFCQILRVKMSLKKGSIFLKNGFLLLEAMVSLALLLSMVLGIAFCQATVVKWQSAAHQRWKATVLARNMLDSLIHDTKFVCPLKEGDFTITVVRGNAEAPREMGGEGEDIGVGHTYRYVDVMVKVAW